MPSRKFEFFGHDGSLLAGRLDLPTGAVRAHALFAHCFTGSKDGLASARISMALARAGIAALRFDFTGLGMSEGEFANTDFSSNVADLVCAADAMRRSGRAPALLVGHSLGGDAVLAAAAHIPEATAVATLGAPAEPIDVEHLLGAAAARLRAGEDVAEVSLYGRRFVIRRQFLEDVAATRLRDCVARLRCALLVMHSPADELVDIGQARTLYAAAPHPKSFVSLADADHLLTCRADAEYAADVLAAWAGRYLPPPVVQASALDEVTVSEAGGVRYANVVAAGGHLLAADEPSTAGGADTGPPPHALVLAGLGACTSITVRMVADRKGMPLQQVSVSLRRQTSPQESIDGRRMTVIERHIRLDGPLSADQRDALLRAAGRCPVHRTLTGDIRIDTRLQPPTADTETS